MTEQRECSKCNGTGTDYFDRKTTCSSCGGRGWRMVDVNNSNYSNDSGTEPLFFKSLLSTGIVLGLGMGGYFGWCVGGIGGTLTYGAIGAAVLGICAGLFSTFLRMLIKICIGIGIIIAINLLWNKGNPNSIDLKNKATSVQR